jgi:hypothetical protein
VPDHLPNRMWSPAFTSSSLSELSCQAAGLAVPEWRAWNALAERLRAAANSGHLFQVSKGWIVPPQR